jgi:serine/threonine protein kinase
VQRFGKYRLLEPVAAGGMAEVWRAEAPGAEGFVKEVALKLIRGDHDARGDFVRMFIQEARLASRLSHANIVQVFDFDQVEGRYYIAMELVRGHTLREVVERCREQAVRFGVARAVHVCWEVARALAYAHRLEVGGEPVGLVHRDVSPQNVLVSFEGEVKLTDFGIARALGAAEATAPGVVKGKLAYMAPEQARGEPLDAAADVFAVGVMLWELCTGGRLFARDGDAATLGALLSSEPISPPSAWNEAVPPALDAVVLAALERDPRRRTASAEELADALAAIRLQIAARHEDLDLRALMRRLWPDHRTRAARREPEPTVRRPVAVLPERADAPAQDAAAAEADAPTATVVKPARGGVARRRKATAGAVVAVAVLGAMGAWGIGKGRGGAAPSATTATPTPTPTATSTSTLAATPTPAPTPTSTPTATSSALPEPIDSARSAASAQDALRTAESKGPNAPAPAPRRTPAVRTARAHPSPAVVSITSSPWAFVQVDGVDRGEAPLSDVQLPPGRHVFRAVNPHVGTDETRVDLAPGQRWSWNARPQRR